MCQIEDRNKCTWKKQTCSARSLHLRYRRTDSQKRRAEEVRAVSSATNNRVRGTSFESEYSSLSQVTNLARTWTHSSLGEIRLKVASISSVRSRSQPYFFSKRLKARNLFGINGTNIVARSHLAFERRTSANSKKNRHRSKDSYYCTCKSEIWKY